MKKKQENLPSHQKHCLMISSQGMLSLPQEKSYNNSFYFLFGGLVEV